MKKRILLWIAVVVFIVTALSTTQVFAGEFNSTKYGFYISWHDDLVRNKAQETGSTILCVESPEQEHALYEMRVNVLEGMTEEALYSDVFGNALLDGLRESVGTTKFESDEEWEVSGYPARKFQHKVTVDGESFWAESIVVAAKNKTFHIMGIGDINSKKNFQDTFKEIFMTVQIQ